MIRRTTTITAVGLGLMNKYGRIICGFLLVILCMSFCGCTDKQNEGTLDNTSAQEAKDIEIPDDTDDIDDVDNIDDTDNAGAAPGEGIAVDDSEEVPDTEVEFSE